MQLAHSGQATAATCGSVSDQNEAFVIVFFFLYLLGILLIRIFRVAVFILSQSKVNNKIVCLAFSYYPRRLIYANVCDVVVGTFGCEFIYACPKNCTRSAVVYSRRPRAIAGHINWPSPAPAKQGVVGSSQERVARCSMSCNRLRLSIVFECICRRRQYTTRSD